MTYNGVPYFLARPTQSHPPISRWLSVLIFKASDINISSPSILKCIGNMPFPILEYKYGNMIFCKSQGLFLQNKRV